MATLLYEELGLTASATVEEIRKAYKKRALQTHPDRLPPNSTPEQKKEAEEHFRRANHAYEILTDPAKRREYDAHGVWPPPEPSMPQPSTSRGRYNPPPFSEPRFSHHSHSFPAFAFQDPFSLFDSIFGDARRGPYRSPGVFVFGAHDDPFARFDRLERELERELGSSFFGSPFTQDPFRMDFGPQSAMGFMPPMHTFGLLPGSTPGGRRARTMDGGRWVSESYVTQTINGVTESVHTRRDSNGNEHVTHSMPDGRRAYTLNGAEQFLETFPSSSQHRGISNPGFQIRPAQQPNSPLPSAARSPPPPYTQDLPPHASASTFTPNSASMPPTSPGVQSQSIRHAPQEFPAHAPHSTAATAGNTFSQAHDRASRRSNTHPGTSTDHGTPYHDELSPRSSYSDRRSSHHQNHLQATHHKSRDPYHPNSPAGPPVDPSPYYLDNMERDRQHSRHHHRPLSKRR